MLTKFGFIMDCLSPSIVFESFTGYDGLTWHPWFLGVCRTSIQRLSDKPRRQEDAQGREAAKTQT